MKILLNIGIATACLLAGNVMAQTDTDNAVSEAEIARYIAARLHVTQVQVDQIYLAMIITDTEQPTAAETFDRIGQPSFMAMDQARREQGYTSVTYHQFYADHQPQIEQWLQDNGTAAEKLQALEAERDQLSASYDNLGQ